MADELTIKVSAKLDEGSVSAIQSQLDSIGKNKKDGIKLQLDKTITTQINTLKKNLEQMSSRVYPIKIQIDQTAISNIQNLTDSLNKAVANVQNSVNRSIANQAGGNAVGSGHYTGMTSYSVTKVNGANVKEVEKYNDALGEQRTIIRDLQSEEQKETKILTTNYEAKAKAREKAAKEEQKYQDDMTKLFIQARQKQAKEEAKAEKEARDYERKEQQKEEKENLRRLTQQQNEEIAKQRDRDQKSSMYAGMFQQIEKEEQKERDRITKEEQKRQDDYTKLHIQARQKQAKEDERLAKEEQKRQNDYDKLFAEAERRRIQQEADAKKASEQSYLSDLKKNSKQLEFEQKTSANAQSLITNAQNELSLLEKSTFSGSKALTGDYAERAREEIAKVSAEFDKLKEAAGKSFSDAMGVSKDGLAASLKNLGAELDKLKGLQYPADKLAAKDVDTLKLDYGNKIQEFRDQLKEAGLESSEFTTKLNTLDQSLQTVGAVDGSGTVWADWKAQFESLQASYEKFQASASGKGLKLAESIDAGQLEQVKQLSETLNSLPESVSGSGVAMLKDELSGLSLGYQDLIAQLQSGNLTNDEFTDLSNKAKELDDRLKQVASSAKIFQDGFKNEQALEKYSLNVENLKNRFDRLKQKYDEFVEANPSKANSNLESMFERVGESINNIDPTNISTVSAEVRNLGTAVNNVVSPAQSLSQILTQNLGGVGQYLARFTSAFYIINKSIQTIKSMVNKVTELDTSLMELQKVTTLSGDSLAQFTDNAYKTGKEVGRTGKDVIDAVTTFSRAGYNLEESNELAKAALTMTNVGVDIPNTEAAASDMISILRAYDKQANESMQVIDELYNVANKEPLDFGNITDMLVTAGGTLAQSNTSLEETMGLLTAGFATLRDNSVANG